MRRAIGSTTALCASLLVAIGVSACGSGVPSDAVATVDGNAISKTTFEHWLAVTSQSRTASKSKTPKAPVVPQPPHYAGCIARLREDEGTPAKGAKPKSEAELKKDCAGFYEAAKSEALTFLVASEWTLDEAARRKLSVSKEAVYKELGKLKKADYPKESEFKALLLRSGQTVSDIALRIKLEMLERKIEGQVLRDARKKPSSAEVKKYYEAHKSLYGAPERRNLRILETKTKAEAGAAKGEIEGGASFASVAEAVSIESVSKKRGGVLEGVAQGQQEKALSAAVFAAKAGVLSGPVKTPFGYYVFEVTKALAATQKPLKDVSSEAAAALLAERERSASSKFSAEFKQRWRAKTQCSTSYVVELCENYAKSARKTSKGTSSTPTRSGG